MLVKFGRLGEVRGLARDSDLDGGSESLAEKLETFSSFYFSNVAVEPVMSSATTLKGEHDEENLKMEVDGKKGGRKGGEPAKQRLLLLPFPSTDESAYLPSK